MKPRATALFVLLFSGSAWAQSWDDTRRALIDQATQARDHGELDRALQLARQAEGLRASPSLSLAIAEIEQSMQRPLAALQDARACVRALEADTAARDRARALAVCSTLVNTIEARVGRVTFSVAGDPSRTELRLDGRSVPRESWEGGVEAAHAARGLDPELGAHDLAHEGDVFGRGAAAAEARRGLHEGGARGLRERARDDLLVAGEHRGLEDDLDHLALRGAHHAGDVVEHQGVVARSAARPTLITMSISSAPARMASAVSKAFALGDIAPSGKPTTAHTATVLPRNCSRTKGTFTLFTQTEKKCHAMASEQSFRRSSRVASGLSSVWSMMRARSGRGFPPAPACDGRSAALRDLRGHRRCLWGPDEPSSC